MKSAPQKYSCKNPNCKRVFSRAKVIKYYVCPTCQTLVDIKEIEQQEVPIAAIVKKRLKNKKVKAIKLGGTIDQNVDVVASVGEGKSEEVCENVDVVAEKSVMQNQPDYLPQDMVELTPSQQPEKKEVHSPSGFNCLYGFGYLSQREKGESIPDTCIECPDSLDCMLSEYYKKEENVKAIKKWYNF